MIIWHEGHIIAGYYFLKKIEEKKDESMGERWLVYPHVVHVKFERIVDLLSTSHASYRLKVKYHIRNAVHRRVKCRFDAKPVHHLRSMFRPMSICGMWEGDFLIVGIGI